MPTTQTTINVAYIAGYGRSGSTLLERILSSHPAITGLGEIAYLADTELGPHYWEVAEGIPLWEQVRERLQFEPSELARRERIQLRHESRLTGWFHWLFRTPSTEYQQHTLEVVRTIRDAVPTESRWLIDSSKTARERFFRPFMFRRLPNLNCRMIHLVRDPRGSVQSVRRGSNAAMELGKSEKWTLATLRAAYGWTMSNLAGVLFRAMYGASNYVRIRYEELASDPVSCLKRLEPMLGVDFAPVLERVRSQRPLPPGDQFAGNRMRLESTITLKTDERWRSEMPRWMQMLVTILCLPVSLFVMRKQPPVQATKPEHKTAA